MDPGLRGREPPETVPQEQTTIESAKENPSNLDPKVLESEAMTHRVSKLGVVAATSRLAVPWNTRAQSCLGFICGLAGTASASERHDVWNDGSDGPDLHIRGECWGRRSSRGNDAGVACGHEQVQRVESADAAQRWGAVEHPKADQKNEKSVRQVDRRVLSAHR